MSDKIRFFILLGLLAISIGLLIYLQLGTNDTSVFN
jgi:hypothetical protein